jgi:hypothetical protein
MDRFSQSVEAPLGRREAKLFSKTFGRSERPLKERPSLPRETLSPSHKMN